MSNTEKRITKLEEQAQESSRLREREALRRALWENKRLNSIVNDLVNLESIGFVDAMVAAQTMDKPSAINAIRSMSSIRNDAMLYVSEVKQRRRGLS